MTAFGFCVVAALSSQISGRPCTRSSRIGKSRRMSLASSGRFATPKSSGTTSGRNSYAPCRGAAVVSAAVCVPLSGAAVSDPATSPNAGTLECGVALRRSASVDGGAEVEEGNAGTPGADCAPGTPGKENSSLNDGSDVAAPGYIALSGSADEAGELVDWMPRSSGVVMPGTAGVTAFTSCG